VNEVRPGYLLSHRATILVFFGVMLGMLLAALNTTVVATALPDIVADLGGMEHYSWVFSAYMLASTVTVPLYGRLSDIYGRRPFFIAAILIFIAGSVVAGTSHSMTQLIAGRAIQGLGAGGLVPLAFTVIGDLVPASERGRWQGFTGAVFGVASVLGPLTGGWIADNTDWRWVFFVSLPLAIVALVVVWFTLHIPRQAERAGTVDFLGSGLLVGGLAAGLVATVQGGEAGWSSARIVGLFAASAVILAAFIGHERRIEHPIVPMSLFRIPTFRLASAASVTVGVSMFVAIMFVPLFMQEALGTSATNAGLVLTPLMLALVVSSVGSGQVIARTGRYRWALLGGPVVMAAGFGLLAGMDASSTRMTATVAMVVLGLGMGLTQQNLVLVLQNAVPIRHLGVATSSGQFARTIGGTVGVSVMGAILSAGLAGHAGSAHGQAVADAIHPIFLLGLPLMAVALLLTIRIPEIPLRRSVREETSTSVEPATA
jgi:EmrB/QacA subfamily drug resistance transporter